MEMTDSIENFKKNLIDAGCETHMIYECLDCYEKKDKEKQLRLLMLYRKHLLEKIHQNQKQMECLDYLIYNMRKDI